MRSASAAREEAGAAAHAVAASRIGSARREAEVVPIEGEAFDRVVRTLDVLLPPTRDRSRNLAWLAPLAFGEAWHNNHHAFPTSARHGLRRWELDPGAWLIAALERSHLAWDVIRISPRRQAAKRGLAASG